MDGVLNANKPIGPTSHDVVVRIRKALHIKRVGHAGTLDPLASGVLIICVGTATRITQYIAESPKKYSATAVLGAETNTEDATGDILQEADASSITSADVEAALMQFRGTIMQSPPMFSAIRHKGRRLYDIARSGGSVDRPTRPVEIYSLQLTQFQPGPRAKISLEITCSPGTYIRTLCADIGRALGCGGYMASLTRTAVGTFGIEDAHTLAEIEQAAAEGNINKMMLSIEDALNHLPSTTISTEDAVRLVHGVAVPPCIHVPETPHPLRIYDPGNRLLAIGKLLISPEGEQLLKPEKVFATNHPE